MLNLVPVPILLLPLLIEPLAMWQQERGGPAPQGTRTIVRIQQHVVVRVPRVSQPRQPIATSAPLPPIAWVERRADSCVAMETLAGAAITRADSVDLVMADGKRMRARLDSDCHSLGFYSGFYVRPTEDGRICARRDTIRSRSGGECRIEGFSALVPAR
jgi:hypothetical protein